MEPEPDPMHKPQRWLIFTSTKPLSCFVVLLALQNHTFLLSKVKLAAELLKNMGPRYLLFRAKYEASRLTGLFAAQFPTDPPQQVFISLAEWRKLPIPRLFTKEDAQAIPRQTVPQLSERVANMNMGKYSFFNAFDLELGPNPDWNRHPETDYTYDSSLHWTQIADFSAEAGDIKYVWERSRFGFVADLIRLHHHTGSDTAESIFSQIESWIAQSPINCGPNYRCSQEISLRVMHWTFALHYFADHPALTENRFSIMLHHIYWQLKHVYQNIDFSRIAVRNNHAITETLMLYLGGLWYPFFPEAAQWKKEGKAWLEEEVAYQIYPDGTYLQWSMNYHRVVVQLLTLALSVARKANEGFSETFMERSQRTLFFLLDCVQPQNGKVPNYGNNDGALFFRFADQDYLDYRPQLDALHVALFGSHVFEDQQIHECGQWLGLSAAEIKPWQKTPVNRYDEGGFYMNQDGDTFTFLRCAGYKHRPAQADNLHLDIWVDGENILRDAGSYKYNTLPALTRFFAGTAGHNTVMLGQFDQMEKGPRFVWLKWNKLRQVNVKETEETWAFEGSIEAFAHVKPGIVLKRKVTKWKLINRWQIDDTIENAPAELPIHQIWNPNPAFRQQLSITAEDESGTLHVEEKPGWYSGYYGLKEPTVQWVFTPKSHKISTVITLL